MKNKDPKISIKLDHSSQKDLIAISTILAILALLACLITTSGCCEKIQIGENKKMNEGINTEVLGRQGSIEFTLNLKDSLCNGFNAEKSSSTLFTITNLCEVKLNCSEQLTALQWVWNSDFSKRAGSSANFTFMMPEFSSETNHKLLFTWDSEKGFFDGYYNGHPLRIPGSQFSPWDLKESSTLNINNGPFSISNINTSSDYLSPALAKENIPQIGPSPFNVSNPEAVFTNEEIDKRRGKIIYNGPQIDPTFSKWIKEGPVKTSQKNSWTHFSSSNKSNNGKDGHIVWWCPEEFPESFIAEWELQLTTKPGLCIVFFAATGENGETIFDSSLPARDGLFAQYTNGAIKSYHISYYTNTPFNPGRVQANLRKNNNFMLLGQGPGAISPDNLEPHKVQLIKDKNRIWMAIDGKTIISTIDKGGERYGNPYKQGYIGLRQMQWTQALYKNFKVYNLND